MATYANLNAGKMPLDIPTMRVKYVMVHTTREAARLPSWVVSDVADDEGSWSVVVSDDVPSGTAWIYTMNYQTLSIPLNAEN